MTRLIIADASRVTSSEAFDVFSRLFGRADPQEQAEKAEALEQHRAAMQESYRLPRLMDGIERRAELKAAYEARIREIEERYAEGLTETHGDPLLGKAA